MSKSDENWQNLGTIGGKLPVQTRENSTGTQLSEIGSGRPLTVSAVVAAMRPADTEHRMLAALGQLSGRQPVLHTRTMFPSAGPTYSVVESVKWDCPADKLAQAGEIVAASFRSAPAESLAAALVKLRMLTRGRDQRSPQDQEAEYVIWIENLRCYPGDIVLETLAKWPTRKGGEWWPTWNEVQAELQQRQDRRLAIANFIRMAIKAGATPSLEYKPREETAEHRAAVVAKFWDNWAREELKPTKRPPDPKEALAKLCEECGVSPEAVDKLSDEAAAILAKVAP